MDQETQKILAAILESAEPVSAEPVDYQFYCNESNKWCHFINDEHMKNTIEDGYKVRALYTSPQPAWDK